MKRLTAHIVAPILVVILAWLAPLPAHAKEPDSLTPASNWLHSCIQTADTLSVLFVMDRSGSLSDEDPKGVRFDGMRSALTGLAAITRPDGRRLAVEVAVAAFNTSYYSAAQIADWTQINTPDAAKRIDRVVARAATRATATGGTDFEEALKGGLADFRSRLQPNTCRLMLWFTDGQFDNARGADVSRGGGGVIDQARKDMCAPTGVVADIRKAGIVLIGLQLGKPSADLRRMSVGTLDGRSCGGYPIQAGRAPGGYLHAGDVGDLTWMFTRMGDLARGCTPTGSRGGRIDPGLHQLIVRVQRPELRTGRLGAETLTLRAPGGTVIKAPVPGHVAVAGYDVTTNRDAAQVGAVVTFPDGGGAGEWTADAQFTPPTDGLTFCVISGLVLRAPADQPLLAAGRPSILRAVVHDHRGSPADLSVYSAVVAKAEVRGTKALPSSTTVNPDGRVEATVTPGVADPFVRTRFTVDIKTASGLALPALLLAYDTGVLSNDLPRVDPPSQLHLGTAIRLEPASGVLTLTGARNGPSRVCLGDPVQTEESRHDGVLGYDVGCVELKPSEQRTLTVSVTPQRELVGQGSAEIPVKLVSASTGQVVNEPEFSLAVTWRYDIPINEWVRILVIAVALLVTTAAVWIALTAAHWITARYNTRGLRAAVVDVWMTDVGLRRVNPLPQFPHTLVSAEEFGAVPPRPPRRISRGSVTLIARAPRLPLQGAEFFAEPSSGRRIVSNVGLNSHDGRWAPTTPNLDLLVVLTAADHDIAAAGDAPVRATLVVYTTRPALPDISPAVIPTRPTRERWQRAISAEAASSVKKS